jgi:O-acetyl-ADP-ribose deacetylase (regulator of RNase III)
MIEFGAGNLLHTEVDALVNTVNTMGVMGKGMALQFKMAHPANFTAYKRACDNKDVRIGHMFVWDSHRTGPRRFIINFPTKGHWRSKSRIEDIEAGLHDLVRCVTELGVTSIALPGPGCGNGGLNWNDVLPRIKKALDPLPVRAIVYPPTGAPPAKEMPIATKKPPMTLGRAALLIAVARYARGAMVQRLDLLRPGASLLEIQKLMYLIQDGGIPLRLQYVKALYGPYAENLNPVLRGMEGHYLRGYGDRSTAVLALEPIEVMSGAENQALDWLSSQPDVLAIIDRVLRLTSGWEDAYGMELLATVLFATRTDPQVANDPGRAVNFIHEWNARKQNTFPAAHVAKAWQRLRDEGWLTPIATT